MNCIICASHMSKGLLQWHFVCHSCGYESSSLTATINDKQAHMIVNEADREIALKRLRQDNFRAIVTHISALKASSAVTLLDVGSAHGWFLEEASAHFKVLGIEADTAVGEAAASRGLPVRFGYFPNVLEVGEQFDVVIFNDVIEHIPDIEGALKACYECLTIDGLLVLNLPSSRGFFYRLSKVLAHFGFSGSFDRMWQKDLPSPHVHYFEEANLKALVKHFGFSHAQSFSLPALRAHGLIERLRFVGEVSKPVLYIQYVTTLCLIPMLRLFPSDIMVSVFRKAEK